MPMYKIKIEQIETCRVYRDSIALSSLQSSDLTLDNTSKCSCHVVQAGACCILLFLWRSPQVLHTISDVSTRVTKSVYTEKIPHAGFELSVKSL